MSRHVIMSTTKPKITKIIKPKATQSTKSTVTSDKPFEFDDPKINDLYETSQKLFYKGKKKKKYSEDKKEFNDLVDTLTKHKVTLKNIRNIFQETKYNDDPKCHLSQILVDPFYFLSKTRQLLTFQQVMFIADIRIKQSTLDDDTKSKIMYAWIYYCFLKKIGQYYISKYIIDKELNNFDWKKYNISVSEIQSLFVKINNNNTIYYSMQKFIDLEKETGDKLIEHFYDEDYEDGDYDSSLSWRLESNLTEQQKKAVSNAISNKFSLITGYPGTGKSTIIKEIVDYHNCPELYHETFRASEYVWLLAPTGKAIKDLKEKCGKTRDKLAGTIHRFLYVIYPEWMNYRYKKERCELEYGKDYEPQEHEIEFERMDNKYENPFAVFVIDESSMIPFDLFTKLINIFIKHKSKLIMVGDNNQLPPIQVGRPFECILNSEIHFPITQLEDIKRTDKVILAKNIKQYINGELNITDFDNDEIMFKEMSDMSESKLEDELKRLFAENGEYRVITPQHAHDGGTEQCNRILQNIYNPEETRQYVTEHFKTKYYVNDYIIQTENDYTRNPPRVNGDVAKIIGIKNILLKGKSVIECTIKYQDDDEERIITEQELKDDFQLFYSATVHKFQGSQEKVCVIVLSKSHTMWSRENNKKLFYTAISRAQEKCVIIGCKRVLQTLLMSKGGRDSFYSKFMKEFNEYEYE